MTLASSALSIWCVLLEWKNYLLALAACAAVIAGTALIMLPMRGLSEPLSFGPNEEEQRQIEQTCVEGAIDRGIQASDRGFTHEVLHCEKAAGGARVMPIGAE